MVRTALVLSSFIVSGVTVLATATGPSRPAPSTNQPTVAPLPTTLPTPRSVKSLFEDPKAKSAATTPGIPTTRTFEMRPRFFPRAPSVTGDSWLTCGMTVFMADPNVDRKSLKHGSSDGLAARRIEPKVCR